MKVIRPNDIEIESLRNEENNLTTARDAVKKMVKVEDKYIQYVKSELEGNLLKCRMHPFVQAVHVAYSDHLPLVISPDVIWYVISSATAVHINQHSEELRNKFVNHEGKKVIKVQRNEFVLNSLTNPWHEVVDEFCVKVGENTKGDIADKMVANFSTTTKDARVVSQIVLMDSMQKYFDYRFSTMCGIPEIRVTGTKKDWESVKAKANSIGDIIPAFAVWMKSLNEILQHFIDVFDDKVDNNFWNEIYKVGGGSGGPFISGWLIALFPYLSEGKPNPYVTEEKTWRDANDGPFSGLTTPSFDYHMNQVPFVWEYYTQEIKMLFVGGLVGVLYDKDKSLTPVFGYAVTENKAETGSKQGAAEEED